MASTGRRRAVGRILHTYGLRTRAPCDGDVMALCAGRGVFQRTLSTMPCRFQHSSRGREHRPCGGPRRAWWRSVLTGRLASWLAGLGITRSSRSTTADGLRRSVSSSVNRSQQCCGRRRLRFAAAPLAISDGMVSTPGSNKTRAPACPDSAAAVCRG